MPKFYAFALLLSTLIARKKQMCFFKPRLTESDYSHNALIKSLQKIENVIKDVEKLELIVLLASTPTKIWEMLGMNWEGKTKRNSRNRNLEELWLCWLPYLGFFPYVCLLSHVSCVWLCNPMDCSLPRSSVHGILQARILEWVSIPSFREPSQSRDRVCVSYVFCIS